MKVENKKIEHCGCSVKLPVRVSSTLYLLGLYDYYIYIMTSAKF